MPPGSYFSFFTAKATGSLMNDFILHFPIEYSRGVLHGAVFAGN